MNKKIKKPEIPKRILPRVVGDIITGGRLWKQTVMMGSDATINDIITCLEWLMGDKK